MTNVFDIAQEFELVLDFRSQMVGFEHPTEGWQEMWIGPDGSMEEGVKEVRDIIEEFSYEQ